MSHHEIAVPGAWHERQKLLDRAHDAQFSLLPFPYGKWRGPVAVARDGPVGRRLNDILKAPVLQMRRNPVYLLILREHLRFHFLYVDEPGGYRVINKRRPAAVAVRVRVRVHLARKKQLSFCKIVCYFLFRIFDVLPAKEIADDLAK